MVVEANGVYHSNKNLSSVTATCLWKEKANALDDEANSAYHDRGRKMARSGPFACLKAQLAEPSLNATETEPFVS